MPHMPSNTGMNGHAHSTDDTKDTSPSTRPASLQAKKPKAPKVKKPTPAALGAKLDSAQLQQVSSNEHAMCRRYESGRANSVSFRSSEIVVNHLCMVAVSGQQGWACR